MQPVKPAYPSNNGAPRPTHGSSIHAGVNTGHVSGSVSGSINGSPSGIGLGIGSDSKPAYVARPPSNPGSGSGYGPGQGIGSGTVPGTGSGSRPGAGYGTGTGSGSGSGSISKPGTGHGTGSGQGSNSGYGTGIDSGSYGNGHNANTGSYGGNSNTGHQIEDNVGNHGPGNHLISAGNGQPPTSNPNNPSAGSGFNGHVDVSHTGSVLPGAGITLDVSGSLADKNAGLTHQLSVGSPSTGANINSVVDISAGKNPQGFGVRPTRIPQTQPIDSTSDGSVPETSVLTSSGQLVEDKKNNRHHGSNPNAGIGGTYVNANGLNLSFIALV